MFNYCCTNIIICNAMYSFFTSKHVLKIILDTLFKFKSKDRWTNGKRIKQNKVFKNVMLQNFADDIRPESKACSIAMWTKRKRINKPLKIYN